MRFLAIVRTLLPGTAALLRAVNALLILAIMLLGLCAQFSRALRPMFPPGNNAKADMLHQVAAWVPAMAGILLVLALGNIVFLSSRPTRWWNLLAAIMIAAVAWWGGDPGLLVLPLLALFPLRQPRIESGLGDSAACRPAAGMTLAGLPVVILGSALAAVTFTVNLNYYLPGKGLWYLSSVCLQLTAFFAVVLTANGLLCARVAMVSLTAARLLWLLVPGLIFFLSLRESITGFASKLGLSAMSAAIPMTVALLVTLLFPDGWRQSAAFPGRQQPAPRAGMTGTLTSLLVIAALLNTGFRLTYVAEKDLVLDVFQDVLFLGTAVVLVLMMSRIWAVLLQPRFPGYMIPLVAALAAVLTWAAFPLYSGNTWTYQMEGSREFARFVSAKVRRGYAWAGIPDQRDVAVKEAWLRTTLAGLRPEKDSLHLEATIAPQIPAHTPPHVFLFVSDATTRHRMGVYGYSRDNTPRLQAFAGEALLYRNFHAASSATFQSVVTIFSGMYGGRQAKVDPVLRTRLCEGLQSRGYRLYMAGIGFDLNETGKHCQPAERLSPEGNLPADFDRLRDSLRKSPDQPHFVYIHVNGGHNPWQVSPEDEVYGPGKFDIYDAMLRVADRQFGQLLDFLHAEGVYERSVIVFTSDHGIGMGYHMDKSSYSNLYAHNTDIPFLIRIPGIKPGEIRTIHTHADLLPGFAGLLGFPVRGPLAGIGLGLDGTSPVPSSRCVFAIAEYKNAVAMICGTGKKMIWDMDARIIHVYDLQDVLEEHNLVDEMSREEVAALAAPLLRFVADGAGTYMP